MIAKSLLLLFLTVPSLPVWAADGDSCEQALSAPVDDVQRWYTLGRILVEKIGNKKNPFLGTELKADEVGKVHKRFRRAYPTYARAVDIRNESERSQQVSVEDYNSLREEIQANLKAATESDNADHQFAALESLRIMAELESRLPLEALENVTTSEDAKAPDDKKEKSNEPPAPPQIQQPEDHYSPEQTDLAEGDGSSENVEVVSFTTPDNEKPLPFLRQRIYDIITYDDMHASPGVRGSALKPKGKVVAKMKLNAIAPSPFSVPVPYGLLPKLGSGSGMKVTEEHPGVFSITHSGKTGFVEIPLVLNNIRPAGQDLNAYTKAPEIPLEAWPKHVQDFVESHRGKNLRDIVEKLTLFLQNDGGFLYYSKGDLIDASGLSQVQSKYEELISKNAPKSVAMAHAGAFNCDGAALIATQILRQYFKIPSRIASGRTIKGFRVENGERQFVSMSNDPLHAWIEVWDGSQWQAYDPTPVNNEPEMNSDADTKEKLESLDEDQAEQEAPEKSSDSEGSESNEAESAEADEADTGTDEEAASKETEAESSQVQETASELLDELRGKTDKTRHFDRFLESLHIHIIEKFIERGQVKRLAAESKELLETLSRNAGVKPEVQSILDDLVELKRMSHNKCGEGFQKCMAQIRLALSGGNDLEAYEMLGGLIKAYKKLRKLRKLRSNEAKQYQVLKKLRSEFQSFNHPDAEAHQRVMNVYNSLPGDHSRSLMLEEYGIESLSPNDIGLRRLSQAILDGKAMTYVKLAAVKEYADLYIKSVMEPGYDEMILLQRSSLPNNREGVVIAKRATEINRMILNPKAGDHLFGPLLRGEQFAMGPRDSTTVSSPKKQVETKMTVVLYDISSSMTADTPYGSRAELQSYLINSFVDLALSETDRAGRPIHYTVLVPFGGSVGKPRELRDSDQAQNYLTEKLGVPTEATQTTDIQKAIDKFLDLAEAAYDNQQVENVYRRLRDANLVLFSDGGSSVDHDKVKERLDTLPKDLRVHMNFVAIDATNSALEELTKNTSIDDARPSYRHMNTKEIQRLKNKAAELANPKDAYYSETHTSTISRSLDPIITQIEQLTQSFITPIKSDELLEIDRAISYKGKAADVLDRVMLHRLQYFEKTLLNLNGVDRNLREALIMGVVSYYLEQSNRDVRYMTVAENNALKNLLRWARK